MPKELVFELVRLASAETENGTKETMRFVCDPELGVKCVFVAEFEGRVPNQWAVLLDGSIGDKIQIEIRPKEKQSKLE